RPAARIGGPVEPGQVQDEVAPLPSGDAEVEPLVEVGIAVPANGQRGFAAADGKDFNIAGIELRRDFDGIHFTRIVSPEFPGKSLNRASAIFAAPSWVSATGDFALTVKRALPSHRVLPLSRWRIITESRVSTWSGGGPDRSMPTPMPTPEP